MLAALLCNLTPAPVAPAARGGDDRIHRRDREQRRKLDEDMAETVRRLLSPEPLAPAAAVVITMAPAVTDDDEETIALLLAHGVF